MTSKEHLAELYRIDALHNLTPTARFALQLAAHFKLYETNIRETAERGQIDLDLSKSVPESQDSRQSRETGLPAVSGRKPAGMSR